MSTPKSITVGTRTYFPWTGGIAEECCCKFCLDTGKIHATANPIPGIGPWTACPNCEGAEDNGVRVEHDERKAGA